MAQRQCESISDHATSCEQAFQAHPLPVTTADLREDPTAIFYSVEASAEPGGAPVWIKRDNPYHGAAAAIADGAANASTSHASASGCRSPHVPHSQYVTSPRTAYHHPSSPYRGGIVGHMLAAKWNKMLPLECAMTIQLRLATQFPTTQRTSTTTLLHHNNAHNDGERQQT